MRQRIADQAHAAQHQEHADRRCTQRQREGCNQRAAQKIEFNEGRDERVVERHAVTPPR
jgi:hypothetical protein